MSYKKWINPVTVATLITLVSAILIIQSWGSQLNDLAQRIFILTLYALLIGSYILRIVLIFIGVFAVYQTVRERMNDRLRQANKTYVF